jgi:PDZ domain-containing protein
MSFPIRPLVGFARWSAACAVLTLAAAAGPQWTQSGGAQSGWTLGEGTPGEATTPLGVEAAKFHRDAHAMAQTPQPDPLAAPAVWIGVSLRAVSTGDDRSPQMRVETVAGDSPAAAAGLKVGDVLQAFEGRPVRDHDDLINRLRKHAPGDRVRLEIQRSVEATLDSAPREKAESGDDRESAEHPPQGRLGVYLSTASNPDRPLHKSEVRIDAIEPGSPAERAEIPAGSSLIAINGTAVASSEDAQKVIRAYQPGERVTLTLAKNLELTLAPRPSAAQPTGPDGAKEQPQPRFRYLPRTPGDPLLGDELGQGGGGLPPMLEMEGLKADLRRLTAEVQELRKEMAELRESLSRLR